MGSFCFHKNNVKLYYSVWHTEVWRIPGWPPELILVQAFTQNVQSVHLVSGQMWWCLTDVFIVRRFGLSYMLIRMTQSKVVSLKTILTKTGISLSKANKLISHTHIHTHTLTSHMRPLSSLFLPNWPWKYPINRVTALCLSSHIKVL